MAIFRVCARYMSAYNAASPRSKLLRRHALALGASCMFRNSVCMFRNSVCMFRNGVPSAIRRRLVWLVPRLRRGARSREACAVVATANSQATTGALVRACKAAVAPPHRPQRRHRRQRRYTRTGGVGRRRPRSRSSRQPRGRGAREAVAARAGGALGGALGGLGRTPRHRRRTKTTTMAIGRCRFRSDFSSLTATTTRMLRRTRSWCRGRTTEVKMNIALD